jgi:AcrR family transcriptional regulator
LWGGELGRSAMSARDDSPPATPGETGGVEFAQLKPGPGTPPAEVAVHQEARLRRAMIEIVAECGYEAVKVRDVVKVAGVSSKTFYRLFGSKEDCFLRTHEAVIRSARGGLLASQLGEEDWRERPRLIYAALAHAVESDPDAAQVALVDAYMGSPAALEQAQRVEETFAGMIGASLARAPGGVAVPPMVIEGMMTGVARVVRNRLLAGHRGDLPSMEGTMMEWVMCFPSEAAAGLAELDLTAMYVNPAAAREAVVNVTPSTTGDRATILAAIGKLVAVDGYRYRDLTVPRIRSGAGVSRRVFDAYFDDAEECFLAALEHRSAEAVAQASRAQIAGGTWAGGVYRAINSFAVQIAGDPLLARVCFQNDFAVGSKGSLTRLRMITGVSDQLRDSVPTEDPVSQLTAEASAGAIWAIFHHHVLRNWVLHHPEISATLGYMALSPAIGADGAVAAIRAEQVGA